VILRRSKNDSRLKRHKRVRAKIKGTAQCPRLSVFRSLNHIYAQIIDDCSGVTLVSASSIEKSFVGKGRDKVAAREVGKILAQRTVSSGIKSVVFDRGGYLFHGRVKELAEGAREIGLKF
jgi:large subunit ribosomal protein L18